MRSPKPRTPPRESLPRRGYRSIKTVALAFACGFGSLSVQADELQRGSVGWGNSMLGIENCVGTLQSAQNSFTAAGDCAIGRLFSAVSDVAFNFVEQQGKDQFGQHFRIERRLGLVASTGTLGGDLDIMVPLGFSSAEDNLATRSFFLQNGITRWRDEHGLERSDVRLGMVHRFALRERPDSGILGASTFIQENIERGHARLVTGLDYLDRWGQGAGSYYMPITGWQAGRSGYEERAIEGLELSYQADFTSAINLAVAAGRWQNKDGSNAWTNSGRLNLAWRPHPWFRVDGGWDGIGTGNDSMALHASISVPLGGGWSPRAWQGLGVGKSNVEELRVGALWQSPAHMGRIEVAEREVTAPKIDRPETTEDENFDGKNLSDRRPANLGQTSQRG